MTTDVPFALYDAFTPDAFGGSQAAIVSDAVAIEPALRRKLAKEIGHPATCFVDSVKGHTVMAQFFSTITELPMCGHGTMALMTRLVEQQAFDWKGQDAITVELQLPAARALVQLQKTDKGRPQVMLRVTPPAFRQDDFDLTDLATILGLTVSDFSENLTLETTVGDFTHLVVPVKGLAAMGRIAPDFSAIVKFCHRIGVQTVVAFSTETERFESTVHVRDFCPAVGVAESAAAGTTNAALTAYLLRNGVVSPDAEGRVEVLAEQGMEIDRPSTIRTVAIIRDGEIQTLDVGGVATKVAEGVLCVPSVTTAIQRKAG